MSQEALALAAKVKVDALRKIEQGKTTNPHSDTCEKLAKIFELSIEKFYEIARSDIAIEKMVDNFVEDVLSRGMGVNDLKNKIDNAAAKHRSKRPD